MESSAQQSGREISGNRLRKQKTSDIAIEISQTFNPSKKTRKDFKGIDPDEGKPVGNRNSTSSALAYLRRANWLRAAVLGANDGLVSTASLMTGVGAVNSNLKALILTGVAGWIAGACSMGIGEFVSVYSQRDLEVAQIRKERLEHQAGPEAKAEKLKELAAMYVDRGLSQALAQEVALELSEHDAVKTHAREKFLLDEDELADPFQAAVASALAFSVGAIVPIVSAAFVINPVARLRLVVCTTSLALAAFGAFGAKMGGASTFRGSVRVTLGGWASMVITFGIVTLCNSVHL